MDILATGIGGIKWVTIGRFSRQLIQFFTSIFLARILVPEDFGIVAIALIFFGFITTFKDFGIGSAIIYADKLSKEFFSTAYLINFTLSFFISTITYLFASEIVWILSPDVITAERLLPIIIFFAFVFLFNGLTSLQQSVMERELLFNKLAVIEIIATLFGAGSAVVIGIIYRNEWSLIAQITVTLVSNGFLTFIFSPQKPGLSFSKSCARDILKYSGSLSIYSFINYLVRNVDYFLIGKFLGATPLGYYSLAYRIILYPIINISNVFSRVMMPIYARLKHNRSAISSIFNLVSYFIYLIVLPYFVVLFVLSEEFVNIILSPKWLPILDILILLIPVGIIQASSVTTGSIYQALGKTKDLLKWGLISGSVFLVSFLLGIKYGVVGVAFFYLLANVVLSYHWFKIPFKFIDHSVLNFLRSQKIVFCYNFAIGCFAYILKSSLGFFFSEMTIFILILLIVSIFYSVTYFVFMKKNILSNYNLLIGIK